MAKQFIESLNEPEESIYFVGAHRSYQFNNDSVPPLPGTSPQATHYDMHDELLFGKHVTVSDVTHMIRNIPWVSGTVYDMYDSVMTDPETKNFYVVAEESGDYHIFKCLNNNGGVASTVKPLRSEITPADDFYRTSDGYEWKYMYSFTSFQNTKFSTIDYVPLFVNANVVANAVSGSIDTVVIENPGYAYVTYATGNIKTPEVAGDPYIYSIESSTDKPLSADSGFYENSSIYISSGTGMGQLRNIIDYFTSGGERRILIDSPFSVVPDRNSTFIISPRVIIQGDGAGALARCDVANGSIESVTIVNRGVGYTYADIEVVGNTASAAAISSAVIRPVISPPGGHGSDPINELYASRVGVAVSFVRSENNTIPVTNDYRKISLIKDPLFKDGDLILTESASASGLQIGEVVTQQSTGASGRVNSLSGNTVGLTNIYGFFETSQPIPSNTSILDANTGIVGLNTNITKYIYSIDRSFETFDQRTIFTVNVESFGINTAGFIQDEIVTQSGFNQIELNGIVVLTLSGDNDAFLFEDGETIRHTNAFGTTFDSTVIGRNFNILTVTISSDADFFTVNNSITGLTSNTISTVINYDNTFYADATGRVHEVEFNANNVPVNIALTNVNGSFRTNDESTNVINRFVGQTSQAVASLIDIDESRNKLVDGSGEFLYIENFVPITRDANQSEKIKLVIEF